MQLGTDKTIIPLFQQTNGANCDLIPNGSDVRFISAVSNTLAGVEEWLIRAADESLVATAVGKVLTMAAGGGVKLRLGEAINCYDLSGDFLGSIIVNKITGEVIDFSISGNSKFDFTTGNIATITILSDPLMTDKDPREFISSSIKFLVVQAKAACELSIISLTRSGVEQ